MMKLVPLLTMIAIGVSTGSALADYVPLSVLIGNLQTDPSSSQYGGLGNGTSRTVQQALGITTSAALQAYSVGGIQPYALINTGPYVNYHALPDTAALNTGATVIPFYSSLTVGSAGATSGSIYIPIASGQGFGNIRPNMACSGTGIAAGTTLVLYNPLAPVIKLSTATTAALASGATISCGYDLSNIAVGSTVNGGGGVNYAPNVTNGTVSVVTNVPGAETVTLSAGIPTAAPVQASWEFTKPYTDAQIAGSQMDWLAIQAAVANTHAAAGGTVMIPAGTWEMGSNELVKPEDASIGTPASGVDIRGKGQRSTILQFADPGMGGCMLGVQARLSDGNGSKGSISDLMIRGPVGVPAIGTTNVNGDGLCWGGRLAVDHVTVAYAHAGFAIAGDQTTFNDLNIEYAYYDVYFDQTNTFGNVGDLGFNNVLLQYSSMAGVAYAAGITSPRDTWIRSGVFNAPYGFYQETLTGNYDTKSVYENRFLNNQMEGIGQVMWGDDQPAQAARAHYYYTTWDGQEAFWDISGQEVLPVSAGTNSTRAAVMELFDCSTCHILAPSEPEQWQPGTDGVFDILYGSDVVIEGADLMIGQAQSASAPNVPWFFSNRAQKVGDVTVSGAGWKGRGCSQCYTPTGEVVAMQPNGAVGAALGNGTETPIGVSMFAGSSASGGAQNGIIATGGEVPVLLGGNTTALGVPLRTASNGGVVQASGFRDMTSAFIGTSNSGAATYNSSSPSTINVFLQGLR